MSAISLSRFVTSERWFAVSMFPFAASKCPFTVSEQRFTVSKQPFTLSKQPFTVSKEPPASRKEVYYIILAQKAPVIPENSEKMELLIKKSAICTTRHGDCTLPREPKTAR